MKTAEEILIATVAKTLNVTVEDSRKQFDDAIKEDPQLIAFVDAMNDYATEAIKADRERVVNIEIKHGDSFILPKYEKNCILNLPIELP